MEYFGIVNKIKDEHKSGLYGRREISETEFEDFLSDFSDSDNNIIINALKWASPVTGLAYSTFKMIGIVKNDNTIRIRQPLKTKEKRIIIDNKFLNDDYDEYEEITYGLFSSFIKKNVAPFKNLMQSKSGSSLIILEKEEAHKLYKHINDGYFDEGLYVSHPKNNEMLLPLSKYSDLIERITLQETMGAYEALGAKSISVTDITNTQSDISVSDSVKGVDASNELGKTSLRKRTFGKGVFDPERAMKNKYFIQDLPSVMQTIESRINGNLTSQSHTEKINLSVGLDINVYNTFNVVSAKTNHNRYWSFEVEFYDKNDV